MSEKTAPEKETAEQKKMKQAIAALKLRAIGPAVMGGRIADIAIHPGQPYTWYVAVGSGGLWKTTNAGTSWKPVFDKQPSYSIGCVTIDPNNRNIIWVGTGENVSGRHVGWGSGVYRSLNGGESWDCMGLEKSEHISRIIIDPRHSDTLFVAAEGPLWSAGGARGLYKSSDGGRSWAAVLQVDGDTGVTDVLFAPDNPDILYAASYQRRRQVWAFMGGGPGSGIHKSMDGGRSWRRMESGLPKEGVMGKIGLAVTPANPNLVYATIEASAEKERGFYRSQDQGESWQRQSEYLSGGTGPHYYQKIIASPHHPDQLYQMDVFVHLTRDGGKSFQNFETGHEKHCDNHALWIDPANEHHLLVGTDGGLYESFDHGGCWRHFSNLPISQFYRVAVDNSLPFYNILGGAQDLGTLMGPARTPHTDGVRNQDWSVPLGADGYHVAFDPDDPDTFYLEWQVGNVMRCDRRTRELQDIKPQPAPGDPPERWNWDTPIVISPHDSKQLYVGSQRLWRSRDRGESWQPISPDLTRNENRYTLPLMGRVWSVDGLYDNRAMSQYNSITQIAESPLVAGLLYVGTDDGLIQVSEDGGESWRQAAALPVPERTFVNSLVPALDDADTVFAALDAHKSGDYTPYLFESRDRGRSWQPIAADLPAETIIWGVAQDDLNPNLLFAATEYALFVSLNRGGNWYKLGDTPTIAFRDLTLQRQMGDLVGASFGRGFYILDDYTPLRHLTAEKLAAPATLFPVQDGWWYLPYEPMQGRGQPTLGSTAFCAPNPPLGVTFTYHLGEPVQNSRQQRQAAEKKQLQEAADKNIPFPGWEQLQREAVEEEPFVMLLIEDETGQPVRRLKGEAKEGLHRISWDMRRAAPHPIQLQPAPFQPPWYSPPAGPLAAPGQYRATLWLVTPAGMTAAGTSQPFQLRPVPDSPAAADAAAAVTFQQESSALLRQLLGAGEEIERSSRRLHHLQAALLQTAAAHSTLFTRIATLRTTLADLKRQLIGDEVRDRWAEPAAPSVQQEIGRIVWISHGTRQPPTATQRQGLAHSTAVFPALQQQLAALIETDLARLEADIAAAGAPWTPGRRLID